ncbi:MAG: polysaccharide biosynthesis/export family protein [Bacteroidaceae bacterium]|nr:polysaccharide biosynthesis/export family protein [Bacteroidaceae bacterium]
MKKIIPALLMLLLMASCTTQKQVTYFQDLNDGESVKIATPQDIRLKAGDQFTIHVNSKDQELALPLNLTRLTNNSGSNETRLAYTVDERGYIDFPTLGEIYVEGKTRDELAKHIKKIILEKKLVLDPVVIVGFYNQQVSVIGEVSKPGKYNIDKDRFTVLDALSLAGDLTIQGKRENITVLREEYGVQKAYNLNLNDAAQFHASPAFYLQQNDIVYVEPNATKAGQSSVNGNTLRSTSFWLSIASLALTVVTFVKGFIQ